MLARALFILFLSTTMACESSLPSEPLAAPDASLAAPPDAGPPVADQEVCDNGIDDDENGLIDDGCSCTAGSTQSCYPGGAIGVCGGVQTCAGDAEFGAWGPCEGAPNAEPEICGDDLDQDCDGEDEPCDDRPTDACDSLPHETRAQVLEFASPLRTIGQCPWEVGDNLSQAAGVMAARLEVTKSLDAPPHAILCSIRFRVPETNMYYDDWMYVLFNDVVVLSPSDWSGMLVQTPEGLLIYDWTHIRGQSGGSPPAYCPGAGSTCELPDTQVNGSISLEIDQDTQRLLFDRAAALGRHDVTVAATGDNDPPIDCDHSDFDLEVTYEYVVP